ncbi:MAG: outer membrane beta-barrel protein [Acidobacteriota bacterium]
MPTAHPASPSPRRSPLRLAIYAVAALALLTALPASAQTSGFSLGLLGGVGGSPDSDSYTGTSIQAVASWEWRLRTHAQIRVGVLELDIDDVVDGFDVGADLTWVGLTTEYRHNADFYDAGYIIGLGYYSLETDTTVIPGGVIAATDEDAIGVHLGVSGHFNIGNRWAVPIEIMGHWADFDAAQIFITAQAGLAYRF